ADARTDADRAIGSVVAVLDGAGLAAAVRAAAADAREVGRAHVATVAAVLRIRVGVGDAAVAAALRSAAAGDQDETARQQAGREVSAAPGHRSTEPVGCWAAVVWSAGLWLAALAAEPSNTKKTVC